MINFNLAIKNPFVKDDFKNLFCKEWTVAKHKMFEVQLMKHTPQSIRIGNTHRMVRA